MYPFAVLPTPTLIFSTIILLPTSKGKSSIWLKLDAKLTVTSLVDGLNEIVDIPIPLLPLIGIIEGTFSDIPLVFLIIKTCEFAWEYDISTSEIIVSLTLSIKTKSGDIKPIFLVLDALIVSNSY